MHFHGAIAQLTSKADDLRDDQLGDTAGVAERRVEDGNTVLSGILEVDLVGTDAEAADHNQVLGLLEDSCGELGLGADTNHMHVTAQERQWGWFLLNMPLSLSRARLTGSSQSAGPLGGTT